MTNVFGDGLDYEIDTEEILNEVDAKLKMVNITNDQKFIDVNEFKSEITKLNEKIKSEITKLNEKIKTEYEKIKKEINIEILGYRNKIAELENKFESHVKLFNLLNKNITKWHDEVENRLPMKKLNDDEKILMEKVLSKMSKINKIDYIKKKNYYIKPKTEIVHDETQQYLRKRYGLNDKEIEIYMIWLQNQKKTV